MDVREQVNLVQARFCDFGSNVCTADLCVKFSSEVCFSTLFSFTNNSRTYSYLFYQIVREFHDTWTKVYFQHILITIDNQYVFSFNSMTMNLREIQMSGCNGMISASCPHEIIPFEQAAITSLLINVVVMRK